MQEKEGVASPMYYYGDSVFKEVMQSVMDSAWIAEWEKLDIRVKNRKSADLEEFRAGLKELSSLYNSVWLKNVIKKCYGDLFDTLKVLLEKLYEDRIEWKYGETNFSSLRTKAIVKRQYLPILLFGLMPKLKPELQREILLFMIDCINVRVHNVEIFFEMDILRKLIFMLMSIHKYNVFDATKPEEIPSFDIELSDDAIHIIYDFIYTLASHNVRPQDLKTMLLPFRLGTFANEEEETKEGLFQSSDYLGTLLRIAQAKKQPPAFFSWSEPSSGVSVYPTAPWSKSGYTMFCWLCIENHPSSTSLLPLYEIGLKLINRFNVMGYANQQIEVALSATTLVINITNGKGENTTITTPHQLQTGTWYWIGITHTKKSLWKSSIAIYLNDKCLTDEKCGYIDSMDGNGKTGYQISFARSVNQAFHKTDGTDYRFQICSMGFMNMPCTDQEMNYLYQLHHSRNYSLTEFTSDEQWNSIQQRLLERCICYYEARNTRDLTCFDCSHVGINGAISEGTRIVSESTLTTTLASLGGVPLILPMFVPPSSEVTINHLPCLVPQPLSSRAYAQALSLLALLLTEDPSQLITFKNSGGIQLLAILLRRCPSTHLSVELVTVMQQIVEALKVDKQSYVDGIRYLLFDFSIWGSASWNTHVVILRLLSDYINQDVKFIKQHVGIRPLLQALVKIYYSEESEYSCKRDSSINSDVVGELQQNTCDMINTLIDSDNVIYRVDISYLLSVLYMINDDETCIQLLSIIYQQCTKAQVKPNLFQSLCLCKAHTVFLKCMCHEMEEVRCLAIQCLHCFWIATSPAAKLAAGINNFTPDECSGIADFLCDNVITLGVYQALMDFTLGIKPESVAKGVVDGRRPLSIQNPFVFNILLEALCSAKDAVRDTALGHILSLVEGVTSANSNRMIIAQSTVAIQSLVILYITTTTATTAAKAKQILVDCVSTSIISRMGGWDTIEQLRVVIESLFITPHCEGMEEQEHINTNGYNFNSLFKSLLADILTALQTSITTQKPKRKDPNNAIIYEGYALSTYLIMCYIVGIMPTVPRQIEVDKEHTIVSQQIQGIPEINMINEGDCQLLAQCLAIWDHLYQHITSATDTCLSEGSKPMSIPLMEKGVLPVLLRCIEISIVSDMKMLYQGGASQCDRKDNIIHHITMMQELLTNCGCITITKGNEPIMPKNDWANQLLLNSSYGIFTMISFSTRIISSLSSSQLLNNDTKIIYNCWVSIDESLWSTLSCCLKNITTLLIAMDESAFSVLSNLASVKAKDLMTYNTWISIFKHSIFQSAIEGMKHLIIAYGDQLIIAADKKNVDIMLRKNRCVSDNSPIVQRLDEEMNETIVQYVTTFEKESFFSIIERETNGLKIMKKLWRELVFGPSMWHGVESIGHEENDRVYYQLDRKETRKRLRNRLKRDWNERPHRHIGRDLTGSKKNEEKMSEDELMKLRVYKTKEEEFLPVEETEETPVSSPVPVNVEEEVSNIELKFTHGERVVYSTHVQLVLPMCVIQGRFDITQTTLYFFPESFDEGHEGTKKDMHVRHWAIDAITEIYRRRYLLAPTGIEIFVNNKSYFINIPVPGEYMKVFQVIMLQKPKYLKSHPLFRYLYSPANLVAKSDWTQLWRTRQISNFEYLMRLNMAAGRTYNDIQQYPVFPWVLCDYHSDTIDLSKDEVYRDLSKPIGALNEERLEGFLERYEAMKGGDIPPFMYGSHYSNVGTVMNFLVRLEPFAELAARLQGGHFDWADRLFHSIEEAWTRVLTSTGDLKELTPEFFYSPHFLRNMNGLDLGKRQDGTVLDDVILPPWASSPEEFVRINMQALESDYVSEHLNEWIDLIFGYKQRGEEAEKANNVFYYLTYEGMIDISSITDLDEKKAIEAQIANFGQTPSQLFTTPHPQRYSVAEALATLGLKILPGTVLNPQVVSTCHTGRIITMMYNNDNKEVLSVDNHGIVAIHKYLAAQPGHKLFPFTFQANEKGGKMMLLRSNEYPTSIRNRVVHENSVNDDESNIAVMRERFCCDTALQRMYSTGYHDCLVQIQLLQAEGVIMKMKYNGTCITLTEDNNEVLVGTREGLIVVWNIEQLQQGILEQEMIYKLTNQLPRLILPGLPSKVIQVVASRDLDLIVASTALNQVYLFNLRDGRYVQMIDIHQFIEQPYREEGKTKKCNYRITQLVTTWNGFILISITAIQANLPNYLFCFDVNGYLLYKRDDVCRIHTMTTSSDSNWLFTESSHNICIFTLPDLKLNTVLTSPNQKIDSLCVSSDNRALLAGVENGSVFCYGLNLRWKEKEDDMPARVDEEDISNTDDI